jgi:hypothetical protein
MLLVCTIETIDAGIGTFYGAIVSSAGPAG